MRQRKIRSTSINNSNEKQLFSLFKFPVTAKNLIPAKAPKSAVAESKPTNYQRYLAGFDALLDEWMRLMQIHNASSEEVKYLDQVEKKIKITLAICAADVGIRVQLDEKLQRTIDELNTQKQATIVVSIAPVKAETQLTAQAELTAPSVSTFNSAFLRVPREAQNRPQSKINFDFCDSEDEWELLPPVSGQSPPV